MAAVKPDNNEPVTVVIRAEGVVGTLSYTLRTVGDVLRLLEAEKAYSFEVIEAVGVKRRYSDDVLADIQRLRKTGVRKPDPV